MATEMRSLVYASRDGRLGAGGSWRFGGILNCDGSGDFARRERVQETGDGILYEGRVEWSTRWEKHL
jgi:hypothetical protein